ncbi:hypothetical protein Lalb_Chr01g0009991 [Lupinus albus]|uniref:Uncharacterized protein n=1 Tax=Lupinus albus TaxID=3870 RepID=A0A6A4R714_LUPAL|nr:hypothetical protein Lalb_Chr01g0009991 [Lupinus albus]
MGQFVDNSHLNQIWIILMLTFLLQLHEEEKKSALRDKRISYSRQTIQQSSSMGVHMINSTPTQIERTPLSQMSLNCINQRDTLYTLPNSHGASSSNSHTQPSNIHQITRKKRLINQTSLGINLMNRYHTLCEDDINTNVEKDKENVLPIFESQNLSGNLPNDSNEDDDDDDYSMKGI